MTAKTTTRPTTPAARPTAATQRAARRERVDKRVDEPAAASPSAAAAATALITAPRESPAPKVGAVVDYEATDPVTGDPLPGGVGLLVETGRDEETGVPWLLVAPLHVLGIYLHPDAVKAR